MAKLKAKKSKGKSKKKGGYHNKAKKAYQNDQHDQRTNEEVTGSDVITYDGVHDEVTNGVAISVSYSRVSSVLCPLAFS